MQPTNVAPAALAHPPLDHLRLRTGKINEGKCHKHNCARATAASWSPRPPSPKLVHGSNRVHNRSPHLALRTKSVVDHVSFRLLYHTHKTFMSQLPTDLVTLFTLQPRVPHCNRRHIPCQKFLQPTPQFFSGPEMRSYLVSGCREPLETVLKDSDSLNEYPPPELEAHNPFPL